ncbi:MAG: hypothetical protein DHS20C17_31590 [Cyclobacteriaceae bacterium]|nr:MAG: hypothetical protein DHS20C17_31590 [Cyclobacteriaceae bacterium]
MDLEALDQWLINIVKKKNQLRDLGYQDPRYDQLEEELHDLEDEWMESFGEEMEEVIQDVHDKICPDTDVLLPIAYLAKSYVKVKGSSGEESYDVDLKEGVPVILDEYPNQLTRMVLLPTPPRLIVQVNREKRFLVWPEK